ncbi:MAG: putative solute-binding protein [Pseudomonadota bacterium]|nr:putative solute-binding protein [Pseudomonadota bacterium]MEC8103421.1 putative solute-binding protein [Pseudomonadota bacterium]MEC8523030.1 putative solute-binding protein [Pseudomonadota bacterium]MEE2749289.1 putative solute-binding protein [Pseudomonadota bacterium]
MRLIAIALALLGVAFAASGKELPKKTFCVFDPVGANGPIFTRMQDFRTAALEWGVEAELKAYTNEAVALADFQSGVCDGSLITGTRVRPFNVFTGSLEAVGGLTSYQQLRELIGMLARPQAGKYMVDGRYEISGIIPGGSVYVFVRDKAIDSVEAAAGKKVATLDYDLASKTVVEHIGATMVPATVATFAPRFNNGDVDIAYAPAVAYEPFEMYKGLGQQGGIYRFSFAQMNFQLITYRDQLPDGFGQSSREFFAEHFDQGMEHILTAERGIPENYWVDMPDEQELQYLDMLAGIRDELATQGVYDTQMMKLMKKLRCRANPMHHECAMDLLF